MQKVFEKIVDSIEKERVYYFLTIANTGDKILDVAYEKVGEAIENIIKIIKQAAEECKNGHFGCNSNGQHEKCSTCCDYDCKNRNSEWFGVKDDNNGWIPCSEQLPEKYNRVLARTDKGGYYIAHLNKEQKWVCTAECVSTVIENSNVIEWQPLPTDEGCTGYERKRTNFDMCCESMEAMAQVIDIAKIGWTKEQIIEWLQKEECEVPE